MSQITRIASLGWPLHEARVHPIDGIESPDTLFGYDLILWDVDGSVKNSHRIEEEDDERRRNELAHHLEAGRSLIVMLGADEYGVATLADLLPFDIEFAHARGKQPDVVDPICDDLAEWTRSVSEFQGYLPNAPGRPLLRIPKTSHVVATAVQHGNATVVLLPQILASVSYTDKASGHAPTDLVDLLIELVHSLDGDSSLPPWSDAIALPGERRLLDLLEKDKMVIERAEERVRRRQEDLRRLRRRKVLVTADGSALEQIAGEAFTALGFEILDNEPGRADLVLRLGRRVAVVEVKGKSRSAAERDGFQTTKWVFDYKARTGRKAKGILIVNGWRSKPLADRPPVFPTQMFQLAAEQDLCLLTGAQLLHLWSQTEENPAKARNLANRLFRTAGVLELES